jgi:hypothetical protein
MGTSRDFRSELASMRCYDAEVQQSSETIGAPVADCALQNREELISLCRWIEAHRIRSYVEIGIWTGQLISALHKLFRFDVLGACDVLEAETKFGLKISIPYETDLFVGDSASDEYVEWRRTLGPVDLVLIDGDHSYEAVRRDFEINSQLPSRYLAFHDITGRDRWTVGVGRFWEELNVGHKYEIVRPHLELGLAHSTMGIGIWRPE